ncbi:MAG: choloylglycine hydrolase [Anaeroplasma sp.]
MCTAVIYKTKDFYFGRTLDYEFSYGDKVVITPREYQFNFAHEKTITKHYAIIGMGTIIDNYPLYYDAINEMGLGIAGLNFVGNAKYFEYSEDKINLAQYELIPYLLSTCKSVKEVRVKLNNLNLINKRFRSDLPLAELHWLIADSEESVTLESVNDGVKVYDNPIGVLTNNPPFPYQLFNLNNYRYLSTRTMENTFSSKIDLASYSRGMGGIGLPGDLSSQSRFVRASFVKLNSISNDDEIDSVSQFFHILNSVDQQRGCCEVKDNNYEITLYTSCCNATKGIYYYTTYNNHQISAVNMNRENLNSNDLIYYKLNDKENINFHN